MIARWRERARSLKRETYATYLAARDPRTPWLARVVALVTVAYALSPLDLIPDVIPVLGYLDDLLIVPIGLLIARRLIPREVIEDQRRALETEVSPAITRAGLALVLVTWVLAAAVVAAVMLRLF